MADHDKKLITITLDKISFLDDFLQPRPIKDYAIDHPAMQKLIASIQASDLTQPPVVMNDPDRGEGYYIVCAGRRRVTAMLIHLGKPEMSAYLRPDITTKAMAAHVAFEENEIRDEVSPPYRARSLFRRAEEFGEDHVFRTEGEKLKVETIKEDLKVGMIMSLLTEDQMDLLAEKVKTKSQLRAVKSVAPAKDNDVVWNRVRDAVGLSKAGKQKLDAKKPTNRTITIHGQQATVAIKPRTTTINIKCDSDTGKEIVNMLHGFTPATISSSNNTSTKPPSLWARIFGRT